MKTWVVHLEAASTEQTGPIDIERVSHLLGALGAHPVGLYAPGRCLVQLEIASHDPMAALGAAHARWNEALHRLECPPWPIVRNEVLTTDEFERELADESLQATFGTIRASNEGDHLADDLIRWAFADPLTNLANEEAFRAHLHAALARSRRLGTTAAVLCIDLDAVPDADGDPGVVASDDLLVRVARHLRRNLRAADTLARVGEDRFAVVTDSSSAENAVVLAERLLSAVEAAVGRDDDLGIGPTAKAGVALSDPTDTPEDLYDKARAALALARTTPGASCKLWAGGTSPPGALPPPPRCDAV